MLMKRGVRARILSMHTIKPLDKGSVLKAVRETDAVITIEEHNIIGGLGSAVAEAVAESGAAVPFMRIGVRDEFCHKVGSHDYLLKAVGLSAEGIQKSVYNFLSKKRR